MTGRPLLDTHAWIWWVNGDPRLKARARAAIEALDREKRPYLSAISLWEVAMLAYRKRIAFETPLGQWLRDASAPAIVELLPLTADIAAETATLPDSFHRDPADRIIVATSRMLGLQVATDDRLILQSRLVERWAPFSRQ
jgi:PIN domain nuclease of toxin-antitoxin system